MTELKNCPNCGGILDDTGRCMYCKSKVYDLTDINIDLNSRDILLMKLKVGGQEMIAKCYPTNVSVEMRPDCDSYGDYSGKVHHILISNNLAVHLDLISCSDFKVKAVEE